MPRILLPVLALFLSACSGTALLNSVTPSSGYRFAGNVPFDPAHGLALDLYAPLDIRRAPVVVFFYGGRWEDGTREDFRFVGQALATQGFLAVVPEYRHYPKVKFPAFVEDAARAVAWTQHEIGRYGGDPDRVFVMGHSSGAHLAAMVALDPQFLADAGGDRKKLRGMIGLAGPYDFLPLTADDLRDMFGPPERYELSQPITYVDGENPPLLLLHGEDDETVRVKNTVNLAAAVKHAGGAVESVIYPKMSHSWIIATLAGPLRGRTDVLERITNFVQRQSATKPESGIVGSGTGDTPQAGAPKQVPAPAPPPSTDPTPVESGPPTESAPPEAK